MRSESSFPPKQVTLVVVPRERFSYTQASLESIYDHTAFPFDLIYVDGNSPAKVRRYLEAEAKEKGFRLIRTNTYLSPNQARNIGLAQVKTPYLVFLDNDVIVSPGWLTHLMACATETSAAIVGPLMCEQEPVHKLIHCAGGENHIWQDAKGNRRFREKMYKQGKQVVEVRDQLQRQPTELIEFHCMLVRTAIFEQLGPLDEGMLNTKEHLDFCLTVMQAGESIYFEPASVVTYVPGPPLEWTDLLYYMLRWSDAWQLASLRHLRQKWDLAEDSYFKTKYKKLGWRRRSSILMPLSRHLTLGRASRWLDRLLLGPLDHLLNRWLTDRHAHRQIRPQTIVTPVEDPGSIGATTLAEEVCNP
jgi:GT2 family glycosyltransferase